MLINESTNAMNLIALGNNARKNNVGSKGDEQSSFANFLQPAKMDVSSGAQTTTKELKLEDNSSKETVSSNEERTTVVSSKDNNAIDDSSHEINEIQNVEDNTRELNVNEEKPVDQEVESAPGNNFMDENVEVLQEIISSLVQQITQILDIPVNELGDKLEDLSMSFSDLLSEDGAKEIFLSVNSAEVSDLLVDEDLNAEWNQFLNLFDDIQESLQNGEVTESILNDIFDEDVMNNPEEIVIDQSFVFAKKEIVSHEKDVITNNTVGKETSDLNDERQPEVLVVNRNGDTVKLDDAKDRNSDNKDDNAKKEILSGLKNAIDQMNNVSFDENIVDNNVEVPIASREIVNQVVEQIRVNMNQNSTSMEMQLYPEHLGKIQINVVSKDGVMTAKIVAESETAKQAIESGLANLRESFEKQELKVDAIEVMVSTAGFSNGNDEQSSYEQQRGSNPRRRMNLSDMEEDDRTDEVGEKAKMEISGSSVSYMA